MGQHELGPRHLPRHAVLGPPAPRLTVNPGWTRSRRLLLWLVRESAHQRVYASYTGVVHDKDHETIRNEGLRKTLCLALSDDASLHNWTKLQKPVTVSAPEGLQITGFRCPALWKQGE